MMTNYQCWTLRLVSNSIGLLWHLSRCSWFCSCEFGTVLIRERQVGIVVKRFAGTSLGAGPFDRARTARRVIRRIRSRRDCISATGRWQYRVIKVPVTVVPQGEIALVLAADGACHSRRNASWEKSSIATTSRTRGSSWSTAVRKAVNSESSPAGTYRINTALFTVITSATAQEHGMAAEQLALQRIEPDMVGIVTTLDGQPIEAGEIAGPTIAGHDNFQNAQAFLDGGGRRGLQEQILLSGTWNLNPWFVQVEQVPMVQIPIGYVGVVISFVGEAHVDVSGVEFKHGDLVNAGHKGVWVTPLVSRQTPDQYARDESGTGAHDEHRVELGQRAPRRIITTRNSRPSRCARRTASRSTWTWRRSSTSARSTRRR